MPKSKPHKGLLKRIRITGTGRIKFHRACGRHLRSHKSSSLIRKYRRPKYASWIDTWRLRSILKMRVRRPRRRQAADQG